jgi:NifU-like protein involved in Fe-S cluster formation
MKLQIRVGEDGVISEVKFKTFGCGSAIASSSYITERVKGMTLEQAGQVKNTEIAKELCLPPVKRECERRVAGNWDMGRVWPFVGNADSAFSSC